MADSATTTLDILPNREGPPLSATSDMPVVKPVETKAEPVAQPKTEETLFADPPKQIEAKKPDDKPEGDSGSEGIEMTPEEIAASEAAAKKAREDKTDAGVKREITKERNAKRAEAERADAAEAKADKLSKDLSTALEAISKLTEKPAPEPTADPRPTRDKFETPDAYDEALVAWSARQATELATREAEAKHLEAEQAKEAERVQADQKAQQDAIMADWTARREKIEEKYPDYAEVAERDDLQISIPMSYAILGAGDMGPELAYHLGKNPDEAVRISSLTLSDGKGGQVPNAPLQVFELGRLAEKLSRPKPVSRAPDPIQPIGSRERAAEKPAEEMSMAEYAARADVQARLKSDRRASH